MLCPRQEGTVTLHDPASPSSPCLAGLRLTQRCVVLPSLFVPAPDHNAVPGGCGAGGGLCEDVWELEVCQCGDGDADVVVIVNSLAASKTVPVVGTSLAEVDAQLARLAAEAAQQCPAWGKFPCHHQGVTCCLFGMGSPEARSFVASCSELGPEHVHQAVRQLQTGQADPAELRCKRCRCAPRPTLASTPVPHSDPGPAGVCATARQLLSCIVEFGSSDCGNGARAHKNTRQEDGQEEDVHPGHEAEGKVEEAVVGWGVGECCVVVHRYELWRWHVQQSGGARQGQCLACFDRHVSAKLNEMCCITEMEDCGGLWWWFSGSYADALIALDELTQCQEHPAPPPKPNAAPSRGCSPARPGRAPPLRELALTCVREYGQLVQREHVCSFQDLAFEAQWAVANVMLGWAIQPECDLEAPDAEALGRLWAAVTDLRVPQLLPPARAVAEAPRFDGGTTKRRRLTGVCAPEEDALANALRCAVAIPGTARQTPPRRLTEPEVWAIVASLVCELTRHTARATPERCGKHHCQGTVGTLVSLRWSNTVDGIPPPSFQPLRTHHKGRGVSVRGVREEAQRSGLSVSCTCKGPCREDPNCECRLKANDGFILASNYQVLDLRLLGVPHFAICGNRCDCDAECSNRLIASSNVPQMEIFKHIVKGWCVRAAQNISAGMYLGAYVGELLSREDSCLRQNDWHMFGIPRPGGDERDAVVVDIDARHMGNHTRFFAHSCEPNVTARMVWSDGLPFPCFFAQRQVSKGEELALDYGYSWRPHNTLCVCRGKGCNGLLFRAGQAEGS